jgi:AcrR family transcriptional regulator
MTSPTSLAEKGRRRRSDGERSRAAILDAAARLATVEGLEGLSIGRLADHIGMSKSGLYAHFRSKEELQLAAIDRAVEIFAEEVVEPARRAGRGLARLEAVVDAFASYLERRVFPGGCFFNAVTAEIDSHPGPVREKLAELQRRWLGGLERWIEVAQEAGELDAGEDAAQLAFELNGMLHMGNAVFVLQRDPSALERARRGFRARLAAARTA